MPEEKIRINKLLSDAGVCSRREADRLVEQVKVTVDGKVLAMGTRVSLAADIRVNGKPIRKEEKKIRKDRKYRCSVFICRAYRSGIYF